MSRDPRDVLIEAFEELIDVHYLTVGPLADGVASSSDFSADERREAAELRDGVIRLKGLLDGYRIATGRPVP